jgi:hypothetical protein
MVGPACFLLEMNPVNPDYSFFSPGIDDLKLPPGTDGGFVLADLVRLRQIRVEVLFPVEDAERGDPALQGQAGLDTELNSPFIEDRQGSGHPQTTGADVGVGFGPEPGGTPAKNLRLRL